MFIAELAAGKVGKYFWSRLYGVIGFHGLPTRKEGAGWGGVGNDGRVKPIWLPNKYVLHAQE